MENIKTNKRGLIGSFAKVLTLSALAMQTPNMTYAGQNCGDKSCGYNGYDKTYQYKRGKTKVEDAIRATVCRVDWEHVAKNPRTGKRGWVPTEYYPWNGRSFDRPMSYSPCVTVYIKPGTRIITGYSCAKGVFESVKIRKPGVYTLGAFSERLTEKYRPELSQFWGYGFKTDLKHVREIQSKARAFNK